MANEWTRGGRRRRRRRFANAARSLKQQQQVNSDSERLPIQEECWSVVADRY